jgi:hypothetical protein
MSGIVMAIADSMVGNGSRQPVVIRKGEAWDADDPIVKANPSLFTADAGKARSTAQREVRRDRPVESSTHAPGEKSRARRVEA